MKGYFASAFFLLLFTLVSCHEENITISRDYIINPNWSEEANSFDVIKMKLKESGDSINLKTANITKIEGKLKQDISFVYRANVKYNGEDYATRKVYFNKDNGFLWWGDLHDSSSTKKVLGELQQNTWYLLAGLSNVRTLYYIYIDSQGNVHRFERMASNW
jgi:hypothetical protein